MKEIIKEIMITMSCAIIGIILFVFLGLKLGYMGLTFLLCIPIIYFEYKYFFRSVKRFMRFTQDEE